MKFEVYGQNIHARFVPLIVSGTSEYLTADIAATEKTITVSSGTGAVLSEVYLFPSQVGVTNIDSGFWNFNIYAKVSNATGVTRFKLEQFKRHANGTEEVQFTAYSPELNNTAYDWVRTQIYEPQLSVDPTDRLGLRVYAETTSGATITVT